MSPERINGQAYGPPSDIWALGLTLLECATGAYPYDASGGTMQLMIQASKQATQATRNEGLRRRAAPLPGPVPCRRTVPPGCRQAGNADCQ